MNNIDWDFIHELEGQGIRQGYQPTYNSGVTIASGFDLKEKNEVFCQAIGIDQRIINKLKPYFGLHGEQAKAFAESLVLQQDDVDHIDECSRHFYAKDLQRQYENYDPVVPFDELDQGQATVLISVGFQYGSYKRTPTFIKYATDGNWDAVYEELQEFGDDYPTRRNKEAEYLKNYGTI